MIFVTVGHQMPFDRLVLGVEAWAKRHPEVEVFAQIGESGAQPTHIAWAATLNPTDFRKRVREARVVVSHAGMGTILTALELSTPVLVMPRRASLRETRNDHQVATAERLERMGHVHVARDEHDLPKRLDTALALEPAEAIRSTASPELIAALSAFIQDAPR